MDTVETYLEQIQYLEEYQCITYDVYCEALDLMLEDKLTKNFFYGNITEGLFDNIRRMNLSQQLLRVFRDLKNNLIKISSEFRLNLTQIVTAFRQRSIFQMFKAFGFNIMLIFRAFGELAKFVRKGLLEVFREIYKLKIFQQLRKGTIKVDEFLDKYPLLKKVTGVVVAALLLYIWLNMTFLGDFEYDFDFSDLAGALAGSFSITALFMSPEGLMLLTLFGTGTAFGLSVPWLGKSVYNLTVAIVYTGYSKMKGRDKTWKDTMSRFKRRMKKERLR